MPVITNTDSAHSGEEVKVTLKIIGDAQSASPDMVYWGEIDKDGTWEMDVRPNHELRPYNTYYEVVEGPNSGSPSTTNVLVPENIDGDTLDIDDHTISTSLTAKDTSTVDTTYGQAEADVITNNRTRIEEIEEYLGL